MNFSRIGLGTVEIGLPYGLNQSPLPSEADAIRLLKFAEEMGITYFDTARGYGAAEERIGKSGITKNSRITVGTKFGQFLKNESCLDSRELEKRIRNEIDVSRKTLRQDVLQLVQFHNELENYQNYNVIIEILHKLKDENIVNHIGVATRGEGAARAAIATHSFETIQTSYNILDQRMHSEIFPMALQNKMQVINRSVLLQGALSPSRMKLQSSLRDLKKNADCAAKLAENLDMDLSTLAIRFCLSHPAVSTVLIGTTKLERITSTLEALKSGPLSPEILEKIYELKISDTNQIDPSRWPKLG